MFKFSYIKNDNNLKDPDGVSWKWAIKESLKLNSSNAGTSNNQMVAGVRKISSKKNEANVLTKKIIDYLIITSKN